ncbi:MAG: hypothetical protein P1U80_11520 [Pseudomonadales bacterium]|nr:hypothetical protein [Pseudomonadales bacterium]
MRTIQKFLTRNLLYVLLLVSPFGYSMTTEGNGNSPRSGAVNDTRYVYTDLLELHPQKIVTSHGTYSTQYIPVLDQRLPTAESPTNSQGRTKGKVQLKLNREKQLLEVILY